MAVQLGLGHFVEDLGAHGGVVLRQRHGSGLPEETRGHGISGNECPRPIDSSLGRVLGHLSPPAVHSGSRQRSGGFFISGPSGGGLRMDSPPGGGGPVGDFLGRERRSVRDVPQLSAPGLLRASPGPVESRHRLPTPPLGRTPGLCLSAICHSEGGPQQDPEVLRSSSDPHRSVLATETLVHGSSGAAGGRPSLPSTQERSTQAAPLPPVPSGAAVARASCLETIRGYAREAGFSRAVARHITFARRSSTNLVYQRKWDVYRRWCREHGRSVSNPTIPKIADFLLYLHRSKRLSLSCIEGYKSMLSTVFRWRLPGIINSPDLREVLRACVNLDPVPRRLPPHWDLDVVLRCLAGPPYEPLRDSSFKDLTKKTLFLVALATAKRVSELQALSSRVAWSGPDASVSYLPEFVAKTESPSNPIPRYFLVKSIDDFAGDLEVERLLCPVRALRIYLERTASLSPRPRHLFVSPSRRLKPLSKNALSYFLRVLISGAVSPGVVEGPAPRAHSIRGVSTSLLFNRNWSVKDVLQAATWRSNSVFSSFYLRDVSFNMDGVYSLGPFVAAGQVFHSSR